MAANRIINTIFAASVVARGPEVNRPETATTLVVHGIYRVTRNPMYLRFVAILLGWVVYLGTMSSVLVLALVVRHLTAFQIKPEELALRQRFGPAFDAYAKRVRRWL